MASLDDNKCLICKREIDNNEKCSAMLDGTLGVDYFKGGQEAIFYENDNEPPEVLICKKCEGEHWRLLTGRAHTDAEYDKACDLAEKAINERDKERGLKRALLEACKASVFGKTKFGWSRIYDAIRYVEHVEKGGKS